MTARFIDSSGGQIFALARAPHGSVRGAVLLVPPFAEEMNKSRRMYTELAVRLASEGIATVLPDLHGTGDSQGEFREADWQRWKSNLLAAARWAESEGWSVRGVLATRLGCALAMEAMQDGLPGVSGCVFWQPVTDGARFLSQFLRLRVAAALMEEDRAESVGELRSRLKRGEVIEVAGYELTGRLADQIESVRLGELLGSSHCPLDWMEVVREQGSGLPTPSTQTISQARSKGADITVHTTAGGAFWTSVEIVTVPELIDRSVSVLCSRVSAA